MLLKAMQVTSDPNKLKEMIGVRTVADVYRTLDKMAIRREFHSALDRAGISFDFIINGIRDIAGHADRPSDRLRAFEIFLKTLGLDKYEDPGTASSGSWEETMLKAIEAKNATRALPSPAAHTSSSQTFDPALGETTTPPPLGEEYEVKLPPIPASVQKMQKKENDMMERLYGRNTGTKNTESE